MGGAAAGADGWGVVTFDGVARPTRSGGGLCLPTRRLTIHALVPTVSRVDYRALYDEYWQRPDVWGAGPSEDAGALALQVLAACGGRSVLDVGCGAGGLVRTMLGEGVNAVGVDVSGVAVEAAQGTVSGRFVQASVLALPFEDASFDTVLCAYTLEHLAEEDVPLAAAELARVARRAVFVTVATRKDEPGWRLTVRDRGWWETQFFEAGLRKHPRMLEACSYESLEVAEETASIILDKLPAEAAIRYPLEALRAERGLHMDMLRESGRRSDAHMARYQMASRFVRPGDAVLDVACGLGYGAAMLAETTAARSIVGLDDSRFAVEYAKACFVPTCPTTSFELGDAHDLSRFQDGSVDVVVSFETLEHLAEPDRFLAEAHRVLSPGGRVVVSVPNDWTDETGRDPNPHHLHVYTWESLRRQVSQQFLLEKAFRQVAGGGMKHTEGQRLLREVRVDRQEQCEAAEWWLLVGMKHPVGDGAAAECRATVADDGQGNVVAFERDYDNPALVRSMVAIGLRATDPRLLRLMAEQALASSRPGSADAGAALCVLAYRLLEEDQIGPEHIGPIVGLVEAYDLQADDSPNAWRWRVSNLYVAGRLLARAGRLEESREMYLRCARLDCLRFSPLLATKTVDALYRAGRIEEALGKLERARSLWKAGMEEVRRVLTAGDWDNIWGSLDAPLSFGLPEVAQVADAGTRCAAALAAGGSAATGYARARIDDLTRGGRTDWFRRLERSHAWLEEQRRSWMALAEQRGASLDALTATVRDREEVIASLKAWIEQLEAGRDWLAQRKETLEREVEKIASAMAEQKARAEQLEKDHRWSEEQRARWEKTAAGQAGDIQKLKDWIAQLEEAKRWLETEARDRRDGGGRPVSHGPEPSAATRTQSPTHNGPDHDRPKST